jgi:GNAT superfamily N-acetyltransferase
MIFCDLALSRRLERAEAVACARFAEARRRLFPDSGAEWMECGGAYAVFDGVDSPVTQTFGLGVFAEVTPTVLDTIERFFAGHGAPVLHEVSPLAGVSALDLLCARGYRPIEISSVLYRPVARNPAPRASGIAVRIVGPGEAETWAQTSARGWVGDQPELAAFVLEFGKMNASREDLLCFLAEIDGQPGAAGALSIHEGVALFAGSATVPELRRRGLEAALLEARMQCAFERGCDLAMMVAEAGSGSQRNAERQGFRIAYTRTKWRLAPAAR